MFFTKSDHSFDYPLNDQIKHPFQRLKALFHLSPRYHLGKSNHSRYTQAESLGH
ncbi:hypothetical protein Echvi_2606 [Echinicola vietnamensis DSM 17526]|uniref:Uncharacterized protein n=1 Tax=Echinicola vietnamensis (strain DSM 17526 / LMG 23754 / KMM 6221) TaxID=926556 RepID=L0G0L1_ECHVK|nr:hypothetical protein Echvi_2606 [Echinicola vietnamensis DSM 17526]